MSHLPAIDPNRASGRQKELLDAVHGTLGLVPNLFHTLANSSESLEGFLGLFRALAKGALTPALRTKIALAVAQRNECGYCLAAHSALGAGAGLSEQVIQSARLTHGGSPREDEALVFAAKLVDSRGNAGSADIARLRAAGFSEGEVVEIIANVVLNIFTNYVNKAVDVTVDFSVVALQPAV